MHIHVLSKRIIIGCFFFQVGQLKCIQILLTVFLNIINLFVLYHFEWTTIDFLTKILEYYITWKHVFYFDLKRGITQIYFLTLNWKKELFPFSIWYLNQFLQQHFIVRISETEHSWVCILHTLIYSFCLMFTWTCDITESCFCRLSFTCCRNGP